MVYLDFLKTSAQGASTASNDNMSDSLTYEMALARLQVNNIGNSQGLPSPNSVTIRYHDNKATGPSAAIFTVGADLFYINRFSGSVFKMGEYTGNDNYYLSRPPEYLGKATDVVRTLEQARHIAYMQKVTQEKAQSVTDLFLHATGLTINDIEKIKGSWCTLMAEKIRTILNRDLGPQVEKPSPFRS